MAWQKKKNRELTAPLYSSKQWQVTRERVFRRDGYLCKECKRNNKIATAKVCDHIIPVSKAGVDNFFDDDNLQSLCNPCSDAKTLAESGGKPKHGCNAQGIPLSHGHHWGGAG